MNAYTSDIIDPRIIMNINHGYYIAQEQLNKGLEGTTGLFTRTAFYQEGIFLKFFFRGLI